MPRKERIEEKKTDAACSSDQLAVFSYFNKAAPIAKKSLDSTEPSNVEHRESKNASSEILTESQPCCTNKLPSLMENLISLS